MAKFNARFFGGAGLFLIGLIIIIPIWAGVLESGITELPSNIVQGQAGAQFPNSPATVPLLTIMVVTFIAFVFLYREKRRRARS